MTDEHIKITGPVSLYYYSFREEDNNSIYNLLLLGDNHIKISKCSYDKQIEIIDVTKFISDLLKNENVDFFFENPIKSQGGGSDVYEFSGIYRIPINYDNCFYSDSNVCTLMNNKYNSSQFKNIDVRQNVYTDNVHSVVLISIIWSHLINHLSIKMSLHVMYDQLLNFFNYCLGETCNKIDALKFYQEVQNYLESNNKNFKLKQYTTEEIDMVAGLIHKKLNQAPNKNKILEWLNKKFSENKSELNSKFGVLYNTLFMDVYLLSCIFSNQNKNIVIYIGQKHIENIKSFFKLPKYKCDKVINNNIIVPCVKINKEWNFFLKS